MGDCILTKQNKPKIFIDTATVIASQNLAFDTVYTATDDCYISVYYTDQSIKVLIDNVEIEWIQTLQLSQNWHSRNTYLVKKGQKFKVSRYSGGTTTPTITVYKVKS